MSHLTDDDLVLHYYGELGNVREEGATDHLAQCGECHGRYSRLQRVLAAVEEMPAPVLPESFERVVWARLEPALPKPRGWFSKLLIAPPNLAWAATIVLLIAGAFFAGRLSRQQTGTVTTQTASAAAIREAVLLSDLSEHLDRSQSMLVELVAGDESANDLVDMSIERDRAEDLVAANRLYRQTVAASGDTRMAELLDELERLLVELAASPDKLTAEDLERVKQRIAANDLLFKVRVVSSAMRERQKQQIRVRAGQSS
jgi:hypothetical protein